MNVSNYVCVVLVLAVLQIVSGQVVIGQDGTKQDCNATVCTREFNPQCGSDGRTYGNPCMLKAAQCNTPSLNVAYKGICHNDQQLVNCDDIMCTKEFNPQCGNNGRTYSNPCTLWVATCNKPSLHLAYEGKCKLSSLRVAEEAHQHVTVKPGFCPAVNLGQDARCVHECTLDNECDGPMKCCHNGCGTVCLPARVSKPGMCPAPIQNEDGSCPEPESDSGSCDSDAACSGSTKCCFDDCQSLCIEPAPREGFCPTVPTGPSPTGSAGICVNNCTHDHECTFPRKCCRNGCGYTCLQPEIPKEGLCKPPEEGQGDRCIQECSRDSECTNENKCCFNGCGNVCALPEWGTCKKDFIKYHNGENKLDVNNCDTCLCINSTLSCTEKDCFCEYSNKKYASGDFFTAKDGCNQCHCFGSKVICTDFICYEDTDEGKRIMSIVLGCIFGLLLGILIFALVLVIITQYKKKKSKKGKSSKHEPHSREEAEPLPAKV